MNDDRLDLRPLAPSARRLDEMIANVTRRARPTLMRALGRLAWPSLAAAAAIALVTWTLAPRQAATTTSSTTAPAMTLDGWAHANTVPDPGEVFAGLEGDHAR